MTRSTYLAFGRPNFSVAEEEAVIRVLRSGWVGMGSETVAFEAELAAFIGVPHVVTVDSCTSALFLSLLANGIRPGDEVICPSLTWCSTANAALYIGAKPVFCDVDSKTLCVSPESVVAKLTPRTRAVMIVHYGGYAADIDAIRAVLPEGVAIVEDAAHALGSRFANGHRVGASGNLSCFSFYANKNLSTAEGGAIALADREMAERLQSLRQHALPINAWMRYTHSKSLLLSPALMELGYKANFTDLQAAIGRVQLKRQQEFFEIRLALARLYREGLTDLTPPLDFQEGCTHSGHARHLFVVCLPEAGRRKRDEVVVAMRDRNLGVAIHYAPLHLMPLYCAEGAPPELPNTERICRNIMTLPIGANMDPQDAEEVVQALREILK